MGQGSAKVLVVEDDLDILELIECALLVANFQVITATDGESCLRKAEQYLPNVVILDLMIPKIEGLEVCKHLRGDPRYNNTGILMLTARSQETDIVVGLELGADDYMTKPFRNSELVARVRALVRRQSLQLNEPVRRIRLGPIEIRPESYEVDNDGTPVRLTLSEFRILQAMASRPGLVFTREQLLGCLGDQETYVIDRNIDVHIRSIRKKLGDNGIYIATIRGIGYKCHREDGGLIPS